MKKPIDFCENGTVKPVSRLYYIFRCLDESKNMFSMCNKDDSTYRSTTILSLLRTLKHNILITLQEIVRECSQQQQYSHVSSLPIYITKTYLYNFDPLKPRFYTVKLGFTGVYIIFLISAQNIDCWYLLEPPRRGGSNEYPQSMF